MAFLKRIIYIESLFFISFSLNNWCILLNKYLGKSKINENHIAFNDFLYICV